MCLDHLKVVVSLFEEKISFSVVRSYALLMVDYRAHSASVSYRYHFSIHCNFRLMQALMFDLPFYKILPTPTWKRFTDHCEKAISASMKIVNKVSGWVLPNFCINMPSKYNLGL